MQCVTPMFRRYEKGNHKKGTVVPRSEVLNRLIFEPNYIKDCLDKINRKNNYYQYETIPCNKCWACQLNYSAEWATRIMLETKNRSEGNWFITLTYDDDHIPILKRIETIETYHYTENDESKRVVYENDGTWTYSLYEEHMKTFINSLRKYYERKGITGIKYFYCGEYGEQTHRPHYHIILLHCPLNIVEFYDSYIDNNFKAHWKSKEIERYWDKGIIDVSELEWSSAAYVARYCTKKISFDVDKREYYKIGKIPEFIRMSQGIGMEYYEKHKDEIYKNDEIIMKTVKGNNGSYKPPKAFDQKIKETDPELFRIIQISRKNAAERTRKYKQSISDYTDHQNLIMKAEKLKTKMSMLPRIGEW